MSPRLVAVGDSSESESTFKNDPMARLWKNAQDRETGIEAVIALREWKQQLEPRAERRGAGGWHLLRRRR
jgi:hypothetical protein